MSPIRHEPVMSVIVEAISDGLYYLRVEPDDQYRFLWINKAFLEAIGLSEAQVTGKIVDEVIPAPSIEMVRGHYRECIASRQTIRWEETSVYSGEEKWGLVTISPVFDEGGTCTHLVGSVHDITDRARLGQVRFDSQVRLGRIFVETIQAMSRTIETRDPYTAGHQHGVAELGIAIAEELGLAAERAEGIYFGGLVHDIGKISVPAQILNRPGPLPELELAIVREHPRIGYDIVKEVEFPWPVDEIVLQHHERLDGSGYPDGLRNGEVGEEASIVAVADVVEAMSSHRPYRPALGIEAALSEITAHRGTLFAADAVDACSRLFVHKGYSFAEARKSRRTLTGRY